MKAGFIESIFRCVKCGNELKWGGFAKNQNICWACVHNQALDILARLSGDERELFLWAMKVVAERYGCEF